MKKFWNWVKDEKSGTRTLYLDGVIAEESWCKSGWLQCNHHPVNSAK